MANQRIIGIDFGTSTSVICVKRYDEMGQPIGERLEVKNVTFNRGQNIVPTVIRKIDDDVCYYGYDALLPKRRSTLHQNFKLDLESNSIKKRTQAREDTQDFFNYLSKVYQEQSNSPVFGETDDQEQTVITYPVRWSEETRQFILDCARKAGFCNVQGMDEAQAIIQAVLKQESVLLSKNGYLKKGDSLNILLIDMGAGTTDLVVCRYTLGETVKNEILGTWPVEGKYFGGNEVDELLKNYIEQFLPKDKVKKILSKCSNDKFRTWKENIVSPALMQGYHVTEFSELENILDCFNLEMTPFCLDHETLERISETYLNQLPHLINDCIANARIHNEEIDFVIMTGGHSQWYFVKEILTDSLSDFDSVNLTKIKKDAKRIISMPKPQETVALGAVYNFLHQDANLLFNLGIRYFNEMNDKKAFQYFKMAAEQNHLFAQYFLSMCYKNGEGITKNDEQAVEWYSKAAKQGYATAQFKLGMCYEYGDGIEKDDEQATEWYHKAAEQGYAPAQNHLGWCYSTGTGVAQDKEEAAEWYRKAAEQGHATAQFNLGNCYSNGKGVIQDKKQAIEWYSKAAEQGHARAQFKLDEYSNI